MRNLPQITNLLFGIIAQICVTLLAGRMTSRNLIRTLLFGSTLLFVANGAVLAAPLVVTVQGPETETDARYDYDHAVFHLALEKTRAEYGDFIIKETPIGQNTQRALAAAANGSYKNYVIKASANNQLANLVGMVPFPVDLGIVGYRVAFASNKTKASLTSVETLEDLKKFNVVQGIGWLDTAILRHHGFDVRTIGDHNSMFRMVALNRVDLFPRGANELKAEWETHRSILNLAYDEGIALYYPLPRFLVTSKSNTELIERLNKGLIRAYNDRSLIALWQREYGSSIKFVKLGSRKIFRLTNPHISELDPAWKEYIFDPFTYDRTEQTTTR